MENNQLEKLMMICFILFLVVSMILIIIENETNEISDYKDCIDAKKFIEKTGYCEEFNKESKCELFGEKSYNQYTACITLGVKK